MPNSQQLQKLTQIVENWIKPRTLDDSAIIELELDAERIKVLAREGITKDSLIKSGLAYSSSDLVCLKFADLKEQLSQKDLMPNTGEAMAVAGRR